MNGGLKPVYSINLRNYTYYFIFLKGRRVISAANAEVLGYGIIWRAEAVEVL